ncbi:MAG TPA: diacylglycerol kinase family protein [bacterium]|nr:diacylglycerol kinase family protein [bacterium]
MPQAVRPRAPDRDSAAGRGHVHSFPAAVVYAARGVRYAVRRQPNLRAHIAIAGLVLLAGAAAGCSGVELALLAGAVGFVLSAELLNTAIELLTDLVCPDEDPRAAAVKDVSAAAVLAASGAAAAVAAFIVLARVWPGAPLAGRAAAALGIACLAAFGFAVRGRVARASSAQSGAAGPRMV